MELSELVSHPEYRKARKNYYQSEAEKWLKVAYNLCDSSEDNLPRYAYAIKRYQDFTAEANAIKV